MAVRNDKRVLIGKIVGLYGVEGCVKLESYTDPRTRIFKYQPWILKTAGKEVELTGSRGRIQGKGIIALVPGITDRDAAVAVIGTEIWVSRSVLPKLRRGEYYWIDLEGFEVVNEQGVALGQVSHLFATGANDVVVVRDGSRERLIPFVTKQFVKEVDMNTGRITVDWDPEF